ncbi:MAG TPA: hypothetical protein VGV40_06650 [Solirubrobacteraceae bacterium]|nr:hypothetical protein [Solirubrobacteraceae bacterium]
MRRFRRPLVAAVSTAALAVPAVALAAHESNNRFDLAPTGSAPSEADGRGVSNYVAGASSEQNELWNSHVRVSGLAPNTRYTLWAENANDARDPQDLAICSFTTDERGRGGCNRTKHNEPALAIARVRLGDESTFGAAVLEARRAPADADRKVDDGEIESVGGNRDRA